MKLIRSLMGRRQFLIAAGMTSALGLCCKKLVTGKGVAMAFEKRGSVGMEGVIEKYPHLFSPLKISNHS